MNIKSVAGKSLEIIRLTAIAKKGTLSAEEARKLEMLKKGIAKEIKDSFHENKG